MQRRCCSSIFGSAGKRNQAKKQTKATHSGSANAALPEVFSPVFTPLWRDSPLVSRISYLHLMTRRRFIADTFTATTAALTGEQAHHLARVLRAQAGQQFDVVANGFLHRATITSVQDNEVVFALGEQLESDAALPVHLLLAVIKFDHYEWGLEKATELGVQRITPILARRTEKHLTQAAAKRVERWRRITLEAAKQSRRSDIPEIDDPLVLSAALKLELAPHKLLLAETEQDNTLAHALETHAIHDGPAAEHNRALAFAVGPEGGWTQDEMQLFTEHGWQPVTLGPRILRAETAALAALSICSAFL
jgi:16S rRNA (uracil1498-N3)-methyltransferase